MKLTTTAQQTAFFTKNGYLELEGLFSDTTTWELIEKTHPHSHKGRDLWRNEDHLKGILLKKIGPLALELARQSRLHLAFDQWFPKGSTLPQNTRATELFSIQGLAICASFAHEPATFTPKVGLFPCPSQQGNVLFFRPELLLQTPAPLPMDLYFAGFAFTHAVYIHQAQDPSTDFLKSKGYEWGDRLRPSEHPLILAKQK